jgi:hypothetical protein
MSWARGLEPWLAPYAEALVGAFPSARVTSVYRSKSEQIRLWRNRARNPYPVAPPGASYHEHRRAWDMVDSPANLRRAGAIWRAWGGTWSAADPIHFQV